MQRPFYAALLVTLAAEAGAQHRVLPSDFFLSKRASAVEAIWGWGAALPTRSQPDSGPDPTNVSGVDSIQWNLGRPGQARWRDDDYEYAVPQLNSTVTIVRKNGAGGPRAPRAFLLHHGHSKLGAEANTPGATWYDYYNMSTFLAETADADVFIVSMPLYGLNAVPGVPESHGWFRQFEADPGHSPGENGTATLRFFLEPVVLTTNYALSLGYEEVPGLRRGAARVCAWVCAHVCASVFFVYYIVGLGASILQCRVRARAPADDNLPLPSLARRRCLEDKCPPPLVNPPHATSTNNNATGAHDGQVGGWLDGHGGGGGGPAVAVHGARRG